jgi:hypothetical protein
VDVEIILAILKELTLDFVKKKRNRQQTVIALHERINPDDIYNMDNNLPQRCFLTEIYVSLDNLTEEGFAPSLAEMKYFAEIFEGQRIFSQEEVREFPIGFYEKQNP